MEDSTIIQLISSPSSMNEGFKQLMNCYQEKLYWHIRRIVMSHEDADDVLQNVFLKVFKHVKTFKGNSSLYTWLYRIATNEALAYVIKAKKNSHVEISDYVENKLKTDPYFEGDTIQLDLKKAISKLPEKQMLVFNMKYYQEMKYSDISKVLNTSVGALKASYHHAVKKIQHEVTQSNII